MTLRTTVLILVAACGGPASAPDAATTCQGLKAAFADAAVTLDTACNVDTDCAGIGGKGDNITCDCAASLDSFGISGVGYDGSSAQSIADQFYAQCANDTSVFGGCDASPVFARCSNHVCVAYQDSCFVPDAGP